MLKPFLNKGVLEAGCDEAGRGCLAGPVVAAAVILPNNFKCKELNDSKQISKKQRFELREVVLENALAYAVAFVDHQEIDRINILRASFKAMNLAVEQLDTCPEFLLIDGNRFYTSNPIPYECVVKGDGKYMSIAAASILAKTYRDDFMAKLHNTYPYYDWINNKGYPTKKHRAAIAEHGTTPYHRMTFRLLPDAEQGVLFNK